MHIRTSFLALALASIPAVGCAPAVDDAEPTGGTTSHFTSSDKTEIDPIDASLYGTFVSDEGQVAKLTLWRSDPVQYIRLDRVDPTCKGADCETRELRGAWDLAHYVGSLTKVIRFFGPDFEQIDEFAYEQNGDDLRLVFDRENTRLHRQAEAPKVVIDPIDGSLYGSYSSTAGQVAKLSLTLSDPVQYVRTDRVDPSCTGDACEVRELRGPWGLAHYEGSLTKVIQFYGPDFNLVDEFAYEVEGNELRLVYDANASRLYRD